MSSASPPLVLTFAASDPTGGAGVQADLLTLAALGCHPLSVLTALTVQDTRGVESLEPVAADLVARQAESLLAESEVAAFKVGVLGSAANARAVAAIVAQHPAVPLVVDPVLASGRGYPLVKPNSLEAKRLGGEKKLIAAGCRYVLVTGTHEEGAEVVNTLYDARGKVREDRWPRLEGSYHGSGCTLSSAIAARLAHGADVVQAVREAQEFTWQALAAGFKSGKGQLIPQRFFK